MKRPQHLLAVLAVTITSTCVGFASPNDVTCFKTLVKEAASPAAELVTVPSYDGGDSGIQYQLFYPVKTRTRPGEEPGDDATLTKECNAQVCQ